MQGTGAELAVLGADQWAIHAGRDTLSHPRLGVMARPSASALVVSTNVCGHLF